MRTYNWSLDFSSSQWSQLLPQSSASSFKNHPTSQEYEDLPRPTHLTDTNGKDYLRFGDLDLGSHQEVVKYPNDTKELENTKFKDVRLELPEEVGAAFTGTIFSDESSHLKCTTTTNVRTSNCNFNSEALNENHNPRLSKDKSVSRMSEERSMHFEITREQEVLTTQSGDQLEEVSKVLGGDCAVACDKELPTVLYTCLNKDANEAPNSLNTTSDQSNLVSSDYAPKYSNPIHDRTNPAVINSNSVFQSSNPPLIGFCGIPNDAQDAVSISPAHVTESREAPLPATLGLPSSDSDSDLDSPSSSCYYDFSNNDGNETVRGKLSARSDANHGNHSGGTGHNDSCDADHEGVHDFLQVNSRLCNQYFRDSYGHFRELQNGNTAPDDKFTSGNCDNENPENFSLQVVCNGLTRVDTAGACNEVDNCTDSPSDCFVHDFRSVPEFDDHSEDQSYQKKDTEMRSFDKRQSHALAQNFRLQLLECSNLETNEEISTERPMRTPSSVIFSDEISKSLPCSLNRAVPCVSIEAPVVIEKILQTVRPFGADDCARKSEVHVSAIKSHEGNCEVPFDRFKGQSFAASPVAGTASNNQDLRAAEASVVVTSDGVPIIVSESCSSIKPWSLPVLKKPSIVAGVDATSTKPKSSVAGMTFNSNKSASHRTKGPTKKALAGGSNKTLEGGSNKELAGGSQKVLGARDSYGKYTSASKILLALDEEKAVLLEELRKLTVSEKSMLHHDKPRPRMELNQHEPNPSEDAVQLRGCSRPASLDPAHPTDPKATTNPTAAPVTVAADPAAAPVLRGTGSLHCYSFITDVPTRDTTDGDEY
ncbi:hypothetical protein FHG87_011822 [Trinorchestia longiramus]|nr:hypothetical protein FHG87_011822 [Trinorchestia longiramus]